MLSLVLFLAACAAFSGAAVAVWRKAPESIRSELRRLVLEFRIGIGAYDLKCVVERMLLEMMGSAMPSVTKSYVPNEMWLGLAPRDFRRWGAYADGMAQELIELVTQRIQAQPRLQLLGDGKLYIHLSEDSAAQPGRPSFAGSVKPAGADGRQRGDAAPLHDGHTHPIDAETQPVLVETMPVATSAPGRWLLHISGQAPIALIGELVLGRDPRADIVVTEQQSVSRRHARLVLVDGRVSITDLRSRNGTFVNGQPVNMAILEPDDVLQFGDALTARVELC